MFRDRAFEGAQALGLLCRVFAHLGLDSLRGEYMYTCMYSYACVYIYIYMHTYACKQHVLICVITYTHRCTYIYIYAPM